MNREQIVAISEFLGTAAVVSAGLMVGGTFGPAVITAIGIELSGSILDSRLKGLKDSWLSRTDGVLNHDVQKALTRAYIRALTRMEEQYFALEEAKALPASGKKSLKYLFVYLRERAESNFLPSISNAAREQGVRDYLYLPPQEGMAKLWQNVDAAKLIYSYGDHFGDFFKDRLLQEVQYCFAEELKTDSKDNNKAWRAFQRMLLEGIRADVKDIQASQDVVRRNNLKLDELQRVLEDLRDSVDHRLPTEVFQTGLDAALSNLQVNLGVVVDTAIRTEGKIDTVAEEVRLISARLLSPFTPPGSNTVEAENLADAFYQRFSPTGLPPSYVEFSTHKEYEISRSDILCKLIEILEDDRNRLAVVSSPIGWGKTTLIVRALSKYARPVLITDLTGVRQQKKAVARLLDGIRISETELPDLDSNLNLVAAKLGSLLPPQTTLVFLNTSLNEEQKPAPEVLELIFALLRSNYRCVVEVWDLVEWQQRNFLDKTKTVRRPDIPPLGDGEVLDWVIAEGVDDDDELIEAFFRLEGHPRGISSTLLKVINQRLEGVFVDRDSVLAAALSWEKEELNVANYLNRIETDFGKPLSPKVVEWFALFWTRELLKAELDFEEIQQLRYGVMLGLVAETATGYRARGWFHLFCVNKLRQTGLPGGRLTLGWNDLGSISPADYEKLKSHLIETARHIPKAKSEIVALALEAPESTKTFSEIREEYVAPLSVDVLASVDSELTSVAGLIYKLEQLCRDGQFEHTAELWARLTSAELRNAVVMECQKDWTAIRSLGRAYRASPRRLSSGAAPAKDVLELLKGINVSRAGETSAAAKLAFAVAEDLGMTGRKDDAASAMDLGAALVGSLRPPAESDYHFISWCDLMFLMHRANYLRSRVSLEAREHLVMALAAIQNALNVAPESYVWQRRYFRYVNELGEFEGDSEDVTVNEAVIRRMFETSSPALLDELLSSKLSIFEKPESEMSSLDALLIAFCKSTWEMGVETDLPETEQQLFSLCCGLLLGRQQAVNLASNILSAAWTSKDGGDQYVSQSDSYLRLTAICLRMAGKQSVIKDLRLQRVLGRIKFPRVKQLSVGASDYSIKLFWLAFLRYRFISYKDKTNEIVEQYLDDVVGTHDLSYVDEQTKLLAYVFEVALSERPSNADLILALKYDFQYYLWQQELRKKRHLRADVRAMFPTKVQETVAEMENLCPNYSITWRLKARFLKYTWQLEDACSAAERAYALANYARGRRDSLWLLGRMLITWVYTPDILRHAAMPPVTEQVISKLKSIISELMELWPDRNELLIFRDGFEGDAAFWQKVAEEVEQRLGTPEDFWRRATDAAYIEETGDDIEDAFSDLTDAAVLSHVATALQWASQKDGFASSLRLRLAEAALICVSAARNWQHGSTGRYPLPSDYKLATSITLALKESRDGCVLGRETSPILNRKGRALTWKQAARARLDSVSSRGVGGFAANADRLLRDFQEYYK